MLLFPALLESAVCVNTVNEMLPQFLINVPAMCRLDGAEPIFNLR